MTKRTGYPYSTPTIDVRRTRLAPPAHLPPDAADVWINVVNAVGPDHFREVDSTLLEQLATAVVQARRAAEALEQEGGVIDGKPNPWTVVLERAQRMIVSLSTKLRVSPQSRFARHVAGKSAEQLGPHPDPIRALLEIEAEYAEENDQD